MSEQPSTVPTPSRPGSGRLPRAVVGAVSALVAGVLSYQLLAAPLVAVGSGVAAGLVAVLAWPVLVLRPTGASLGGAAATGALSLVAAYVAAGLMLGRGGGVIVDHDALILLLFSFWIVIPVMVAVAVGLALLDRRLCERD